MRTLTPLLVVCLPLLLAATAVAQPPADPRLLEAEARLAAEDYAGARRILVELTAERPEDGRAWTGLGRADHGLGEPARALEAFARALEVAPSPHPATLFQSARSLAALGRRDEALARLEEALDAGGQPYAATLAAPELMAYAGDPRFDALVERMKPCSAPEYRRFDFWIGEWQVRDRRYPVVPGSPLARNRIRPLLGGCVLIEEYAAPGGFEGRSLSFYDAARGVWHQTWIDNAGQPLMQDGGWRDGKMVLSDSAGSNPYNEVTWTPHADGTVSQVWRQTSDGGETWTIVFDGVYVPVGAATPPPQDPRGPRAPSS